MAFQARGAEPPQPQAGISQPLFLAEAGVPPGFEALSKPQRSLVDIYYGNRYLGSQLATYTAETIRLSDPQALVRLIGDISDPALVGKTLGATLDSHGEQVCLQPGQTDCGLLEPAIAEVIFDESRFRVDVFVNRRFLLTRSAAVTRYLPPSDGGYSFMQNFAATLSGTRGRGGAAGANNSEDYVLYGTSVFAKGENSLHSHWDYARDQNFSVADFYGQREFEGVHYRFGLMRTEGFGLSFTPDQTLTGVRIGSSSRTRADTRFSGGIPLALFLPVRGRVEVRKDNRLIASYFFEAGSQQLDTSAFPTGAYDVTIRVLDEQGRQVSEERRFFAKQFDLPPIGEWRYFMETGQMMSATGKTLPKRTRGFLARAGVSRRLTDTLATTVSAAINSNSSLLEAGLFNIGYGYELSPSVMVGDGGARGFNILGRTTLGRAVINIGHRQLWHDNTSTVVESGDGPPLLGESFSQSNLSLSVPVYRGNASYAFSQTRTGDNPRTRSHALAYRTSLYRVADLDIDMDISYSRSGDDQVARLGFNFRLRDRHWRWQATPRAQHDWQNSVRTRRSERVRLSASWENPALVDATLRTDFGVETGTGNARYDARLEAANSWGQTRLSLNHVAGSRAVTSYAASLSSSFMTEGNHLALGGEQNADSALMVKIKGQVGDTFAVRVNGQRRGYAVAGRPSLVPLPPYAQYAISISPTGAALYDFDERERMVTLYPGNVVLLNYEAVALRLLFGRLVLAGQPVSGVQIKGGQYPAASDDYGLFQLELRADQKAVEAILGDGRRCRLEVPEVSQAYILRMGTIDLAESSCAAAKQEQPVANDQDSVQLARLTEGVR